MRNALDLREHGLDDVVGRVVTLNGVTYVLLPLIATGGEAFVFPLQNEQSGLVNFVGKIYRFRPETIDIETAGSHEFEMACHGLPVLTSEYYKTNGCALRFQRFLGSVDEERYCRDLIEPANAAAQRGDTATAIAGYDIVLQRNPFHTYALLNKAQCLFSSGEPIEAIERCQQAIAVDRNEVESHLLLARILRHIGRYHHSLGVLLGAIDRWRYTYTVWTAAVDVVARYHLLEVADDFVDFLTSTAPKTQFVRTATRRLAAAARRETRYIGALQSAAALQVEGDWAAARSSLVLARRYSKNDALARLNDAICRYRLGAPIALEDITPLIFVLPPVPCFVATALSLLVCTRSLLWQQAKALALMLNDMIDDPIDLPLGPVAVVEHSIEPRDPTEMMNAIRETQRHAKLTDVENHQISDLLQKYATLRKSLAGSPG